jgi:hypothetical protein
MRTPLESGRVSHHAEYFTFTTLVVRVDTGHAAAETGVAIRSNGSTGTSLYLIALHSTGALVHAAIRIIEAYLVLIIVDCGALMKTPRMHRRLRKLRNCGN